MKELAPKISVWVTSTGRFKFLKPTLDAFLKYNTYPNVEFLIFESVPTEESKKIFHAPNIETEKCIEYIKGLDIPKKHIVKPWPFLGDVYNELLDLTEDYYISIEDDCVTVCDPTEQFVEGVKLLDADDKLLGIRTDLRDPTSVYAGSDRFKGTKMFEGTEYVYWDVCSGGAQIMDARKVREINKFPSGQALNTYGDTERHQQREMIAAGMYCGVNLNFYGFLSHEGAESVCGDDRTWSSKAYKEFIQKGWYGKGPKS